MVTHQLQVRCRPLKVRRSETDVLPLSHPTTGELCHCVYVSCVSICLSVCLTGRLCASFSPPITPDHNLLPRTLSTLTQLTSHTAVIAAKTIQRTACTHHTAAKTYALYSWHLTLGHVMCRSDALLLLPAMHTVLSAIQPISQSHADMPNAN